MKTKGLKGKSEMYYLEHTLDRIEGEQKELALQVMLEPDAFEAKLRYARWYKEHAAADDSLLADIASQLKVFYPDIEDDKKSRLTADMTASNMLYGVSPLEFLQFRFEEKTDAARNTYMTDAEKFIIFRQFYDYSQYEYVRNKWLQYSRLKEFFARDCARCEEPDSEADRKAFAEFVEKHPVFIFKPTRMACGEGVRVVDSAGADARRLYDELAGETKGGIADERIEQDERAAVFHPGSVNTVRIVGVRDPKEHKSYFTQALFRIGRGAEIIDNYQGAVRARIDDKSGVVYTVGADGYGNKFVFHPDSGEKIVGFQIPEWSGLIETADRAMQVMESYARYIGFDFALTDNGWKIVEVNPYPQIYLQQVAANEGSRPEMCRLASLCADTGPG